MNFLVTLALALGALAPALAQTEAAKGHIRFVHYNIRELDSAKLARGLADSQLQAVRAVMTRFPFDILSVNEMQYDLPGVPAQDFTSEGANLRRFLELLVGNGSYAFETAFDPANTGREARRKPDGTFETNPNTPLARELADPVNFGSFPGQYSTGGATRFTIVKKKVFSRLLWKAFRADRDLSLFTDGLNRPLDAARVELFDKNFTDLTIHVNGKLVHVILLHAVPAHNFGNPFSMNEARNHDQLAFLEWYLTGATSFAVPAVLVERDAMGSETEIQPLPAGASFIVVGDLNVDVTDPVKAGAQVLKRLYERTTPWLREQGVQTFQGSTYDPATFQGQLDYIFVSRDITVLGGGIHAPPANARELGCGLTTTPNPVGPEREVRSYRKGTETCWVEIDHDYAVAKDASDHRLLWADLSVN